MTPEEAEEYERIKREIGWNTTPGDVAMLALFILFLVVMGWFCA